jgi:hypothetical protein
LCVRVGWLRLSLGEVEAACEIFRTAHEELREEAGTDDAWYSFIAAPGYARALTVAGRSDAAATLVREVEAAALRNADSWRKALLPSQWLPGGFGAMFAKVGDSVAHQWQEHGALLRARMAAATDASDAAVLLLLEEARSTTLAKTFVLDADRPEFAAFLQRMRNAADPELRLRYLALPAVMRSAGGDARSPWLKISCDGRAYYLRKFTTETVLQAPAEGACQELEIGIPNLGVERDEWESVYANLGGPDCWSEQQNRRYKLKARARKVARLVGLVGLIWVISAILAAPLMEASHGADGGSGSS